MEDGVYHMPIMADTTETSLDHIDAIFSTSTGSTCCKPITCKGAAAVNPIDKLYSMQSSYFSND